MQKVEPLHLTTNKIQQSWFLYWNFKGFFFFAVNCKVVINQWVDYMNLPLGKPSNLLDVDVMLPSQRDGTWHELLWGEGGLTKKKMSILTLWAFESLNMFKFFHGITQKLANV